MVYSVALAQLTAAQQTTVNDAFAGWASDPAWQRISINIQDETALNETAFVALLREFADSVASGRPTTKAWPETCREHRFVGARVPPSECPVLLGRVVGLKAYAALIDEETGGAIPREEAERWLRARGLHDRGLPIRPLVRTAHLGGELLWATINPDDISTCPFERLPVDAGGICSVLGLGHLLSGGAATPNDVLCLMTWRHSTSGSPPLHRPTVADAGDFHFYRPVADPLARYGQTEPLAPHPSGLAGQPEVVLRSITGVGLVFLYCIA